MNKDSTHVQEWEHLYHSLDIHCPKFGTPQSPANSKVLAEYEERTGFLLPDSYRGFATVFGPGEVGGYFNIFVPGVPNRKGRDLRSLQEFYRSAEVRSALSGRYGHDERLDRLVVFGNTIGGDILAWDPASISALSSHEYEVIVLPDNDESIVSVAHTFFEFVSEVCLGQTFAKVAGPSWEVDETFMPFGGR